MELIVNEFESVLAELDLDFAGVEAEYRLEQEHEAIDKRLRAYGALDRAYDRAQEYAGEIIPLPGREHCTATVYRETDREGREIGGGVQLHMSQTSELGLTRYAIRVPAYRLNDEGSIRPAGGVFDEIDDAEMVAAEGDKLLAFAGENGLILTADLTSLASRAGEQQDVVLIPCPARDEI